ncbi:MAG TPA: hypothetical protein VFW92_08520 [Candidatus Limnocylindrales bacterium]|nr:hypothetical protein [Candidatus Limnocylindrales bacterium]
MSEPTTEAGRQLRFANRTEGLLGDILAIEAEAAQAERERIRAAVEALLPESVSASGNIGRHARGRLGIRSDYMQVVGRDAVLAAIEGASE